MVSGRNQSSEKDCSVTVQSTAFPRVGQNPAVIIKTKLILNNFMAVRVYKGKTKKVPFPMTPSTALAKDSFVTLTSGKVVAATSSTAAVDILGTIGRAILSTDADYATERFVNIEVPVEKNVVYEIDVTSGLVAADVGLEVDLTDASTVNRGANSIKAVKCVAVKTSTKGYFLAKINGSY